MSTARLLSARVADADPPGSILVVDDDPVTCGMVALLLGAAGYQVSEVESGEAALAQLAKLDSLLLPDLVLLDIDLGQGIDGFEVCRRLKRSSAWHHIPVILVTGSSDPSYEQEGLSIGAVDYINKPVSPPIVLARVHTHLMLKAANDMLQDRNHLLEIELQHRYKEIRMHTDELRVSREVTMVALASLTEIRDNETGAHIFRTQHYVRALATHLRDDPRFAAALDDEMIDRMFSAATLHDIGKVGIPDRILLKPAQLDAQEFEIMKTHTTLGANAIENAQLIAGTHEPLLDMAVQIARYHHEKWNGSGYPCGLSGEAIPLAARLMAVADVYDALISDRVYRRALSHEQALAIISAGRGQHFDPAVADAMIALEADFRRIASCFPDHAEQLAELRQRSHDLA